MAARTCPNNAGAFASCVQYSTRIPIAQQAKDFWLRTEMFSHTKSQPIDALFQFLLNKGINSSKYHIGIVLTTISASFGANIRRRNPCS